MAVTDSTGQHGPWSDQLTVTYDGMKIYSVLHDVMLIVSVPGIVNFIAQLQITNINVTWQVSVVS